MGAKAKTSYLLDRKTARRVAALAFVRGETQSKIVEDAIDVVVDSMPRSERQRLEAAVAARDSGGPRAA